MILVSSHIDIDWKYDHKRVYNEKTSLTMKVAICTGTYKRRICMAAATGNWTSASSHDRTHPDWACTPLTMDGDTALHIAVRMEKTNFVVKLMERISKEDMEICSADGNTAFCIAAISGNQEIARVLLDKYPGLAWIRGHEEKLPIELASLAGQLSMVNFLFQRTQQDIQMNNLPFQDIVKLFFLTLTNNINCSKWSNYLCTTYLSV